MSSSSSPGVLSVRFDKENVDPQQQSATDSSSASSEPAKPEHSAALVAGITIPTSSSTSTSPTAELAANKKKRKKSASAPRTLTKEELAEYIARGEFWQKSEAAEGEGDGYQYGRGDEQSTDDPIYEDCNEVRRKITAFLKTGRMTQTAWCKLLGVNASSLQRFMKAKGPFSGSANGVYPAAARFFESLRILEHKPKSAKRKKEEAAFGKYGRASWGVTDKVWCFGDDRAVRDEMGRVRIIHSDHTHQPLLGAPAPQTQ